MARPYASPSKLAGALVDPADKLVSLLRPGALRPCFRPCHDYRVTFSGRAPEPLANILFTFKHKPPAGPGWLHEIKFDGSL
jgi:hypothetical protein